MEENKKDGQKKTNKQGNALRTEGFANNSWMERKVKNENVNRTEIPQTLLLRSTRLSHDQVLVQVPSLSHSRACT